MIVAGNMPLHCGDTAKILGCEFTQTPLLDGDVYQIGFWGTERLMFHNGKRILHWVGSDILQARDNPVFQQTAKDLYNKHLCQTKSNQDELKAMGIEADICPLPPLLIAPTFLMPSPDKIISVYLPSNSSNYYDELMQELFTKLSGIQFLIHGNTAIKQPYRLGNMNFIGWQRGIMDTIKDSRIVLRFTRHDGFPKIPIEAMTAGRPVITNQDIDGAIKCEPEMEAICVRVISVLDDYGKAQADLVEPAKKWREALDHEKFRYTINSYFERTTK